MNPVLFDEEALRGRDAEYRTWGDFCFGDQKSCGPDRHRGSQCRTTGLAAGDCAPGAAGTAACSADNTVYAARQAVRQSVAWDAVNKEQGISECPASACAASGRFGEDFNPGHPAGADGEAVAGRNPDGDPGCWAVGVAEAGAHCEGYCTGGSAPGDCLGPNAFPGARRVNGGAYARCSSPRGGSIRNLRIYRALPKQDARTHAKLDTVVYPVEHALGGASYYTGSWQQMKIGAYDAAVPVSRTSRAVTTDGTVFTAF